MLGKLSRFASPEIEHLLRKLEADENSYDAEMRSLDREKLVIPVELSTHDGEFKVLSFSRNISKRGVCLITPQPFTAGTVMNVELNLDSLLSRHTAECRWSQKFGDAYWTSGWKLTSKELDIAAIKGADSLIGWDKRSTERKPHAVPVIIHQKGEQQRIHAFSRNMSGGGVNLVASQEVPEKTFCKLQFVRNDGERCDFIAECIWSKKYGKNHWMMGWQFPELDEIAKFHAACFDR